MLLGRFFDTVGRKPMIAGTYLGSAVVLVVLTILFAGGSLGLWGFMALLLATFFLASAGASSAYLTVSEIFPMETRALAIAFFYAIGTAVGGITGPFLFGKMIESGEEGQVAIAFFIGAAVMALGGVVELLFGVKAEQQELEGIAKPLSAEEAEGEGEGEEPEREPRRPLPQPAWGRGSPGMAVSQPIPAVGLEREVEAIASRARRARRTDRPARARPAGRCAVLGPGSVSGRVARCRGQWPGAARVAEQVQRRVAPADVNCGWVGRRVRLRGFRRNRGRPRDRCDETVLWRGFRRTHRRGVRPCDETHTTEARRALAARFVRATNPTCAFRRTDRARVGSCDETHTMGA